MPRDRELRNAPCPWPATSGWILGALFVVLLLCLLLDKEADRLMRAVGWVGMLVAAVTDRYARSLAHFGKVFCWFIVIGAVAAFCSIQWGEAADALKAANRYFIPVIWFVLLSLAIPAFRQPATLPEGDCPLPWAYCWGNWLMLILLSFCAWATFTSAASLFPKDSMELLGAELLPYAGMLIILARAAQCDVAPWRRTAAVATWATVIAASIGMAAIMITSFAFPAASAELLRYDLFRVDHDAPGTHRLQFLFSHHNRAGFFAATAIFLCLAGIHIFPRWRWLAIAGAVAAAFALPFTLTRGALVAGAVAMLVFIIATAIGRNRGSLIILGAIIVLLPAGWLAMPENYQQHISKMVNRENYREDAQGSIAARLVMWEAARDMIAKRPGLGFGYGYENFENAARLEHPDNPDYFAGAAHAHNQWLETGAETGIPGMTLLALFTLLRLGGLITGWWILQRCGHPMAWLIVLWLSLEIVVQIYGITNYPLRRNLGYLSYWVWAMSIVLIIRAARTPAVRAPSAS